LDDVPESANHEEHRLQGSTSRKLVEISGRDVDTPPSSTIVSTPSRGSIDGQLSMTNLPPQNRLFVGRCIAQPLEGNNLCMNPALGERRDGRAGRGPEFFSGFASGTHHLIVRLLFGVQAQLRPD